MKPMIWHPSPKDQKINQYLDWTLDKQQNDSRLPSRILTQEFSWQFGSN